MQRSYDVDLESPSLIGGPRLTMLYSTPFCSMLRNNGDNGDNGIGKVIRSESFSIVFVLEPKQIGVANFIEKLAMRIAF